MTLRALACWALSVLLTGCPFALEDDYYITDAAPSAATAPVMVGPAVGVDAGPPADAGQPVDAGDSCAKKGPCLIDPCQGKPCPKFP